MEATPGWDAERFHDHEDSEEEKEIHDDSRESHLPSMALRRANSMLHLPGSGSGSRSYLHEQQTAGSSSYTSISSSSSGTIVSTAYTSSGAHLSSVSMEAAMCFDDFDADGGNKEQIKQITSLVQEFISIPGGNVSVLERWFVELGVAWVLHLGDGAASEAAILAHAFDNASSWIRALFRITETISLMIKPKSISLIMRSLCSDSDRGSAVALPIICEEEPENKNGKEEATAAPEDRFHIAQFIQKTMMRMVSLVLFDKEQVTGNNGDSKAIIQFQFQFAQFIRAAMLKMLAFVDVLFEPAKTTKQDLVGDGSAGVPYYKYRLNALLGVRDALSSALTKIQVSFLSRPSADARVERIQGEIVSLLSAADSNADEAIWTRMLQTRTRFLELLIEDGDNSDSPGAPTWEASSDIHKASRHVMGYVTFIQHHYNALHTVFLKAAYLGEYMPRFKDVAPLNSLQMEMVSCLQENLASKSELFLDQGLRFLFLINNLDFVFGNLDKHYSQNPAAIDVETIRRQVLGYLKSYLQVSWAPLLACLSIVQVNNATLMCFGRHSQLSKFESEFQKIYTTQKQWKVPNPEMRDRLRDQITWKIVPGYTKYIMDNKVTTAKFSPWDLECMLRQLFEG